MPKKNPGGHGDTVEKGLGPRPLGPIGPTFRRTITVTGNVNKLHFFPGPRFPRNKTPGVHGDTDEKGLGPRPLGPIGPIFRRTLTVTGKVQFLEGP